MHRRRSNRCNQSFRGARSANPESRSSGALSPRDSGSVRYRGLSGMTAANSLLRGLFAFGVALRRAGQDLFGDQAGVLADRRLDLRGHVGIGLEKGFRILAALPLPLAVI